MKQTIICGTMLLVSLVASAQRSEESGEVMKVVNQFFTTLENQDSVTFRNLHMNGARFYIVGERNDTVRTNMRDVVDVRFRKDEVIKERMRDSGVVTQVHGRIAMVWAPYDLWVNDKFSHCGVDVFTLIKTSAGWKIASCVYTVETEGCGRSE